MSSFLFMSPVVALRNEQYLCSPVNAELQVEDFIYLFLMTDLLLEGFSEIIQLAIFHQATFAVSEACEDNFLDAEVLANFYHVMLLKTLQVVLGKPVED